ncbi:MAG: molybdenum cofactor synthesis domain [Acidimicrobiaceae bacterium]|nr:molybdenum cofactor synthesis domain [Acidimicrobiaceae bacterium]
MMSLEEAQAAVVACARALPARPVALERALGLVLAEDVRAEEAVPRFDCSAMDGYALVASGEPPPLSLDVVGTLLAGDAPNRAVGPGEAVRIMTGAPIPEGADAVCMLEETQPSADGSTVVLLHSPARGEHVRPAGGDLQVGDIVARAGDRLGARHLGVLASVGIETVLARPRPRVGVLSTGSELRSAPEPLGPGQIRDSNRYLLLALVELAGAEPVDLGIVADDEEQLVAAIGDASERCDVLLTSGGVSVGDRDVVKAVIGRCCGESGRQVQVAIKPAKPLAFGVLASGTPLIGLPGNPVSSAVAFECFVRPALARMAGLDPSAAPRLAAVTGEAFRRKPDGKLHLVHVTLRSAPGGRLVVRRSGGASSHLLASTLGADALAYLPDGDGLDEGADLEVLPLTGAGASFGRAAAAVVRGDDDDCC